MSRVEDWINQTQFGLMKLNLDLSNSNWIDQFYETVNASFCKGVWTWKSLSEMIINLD
jgi:hypothetical protein